MKTTKILTGIGLLASLLTLASVPTKPASPRAYYIEQVGNVRVSIRYGQPSAQGQPVWGELVPYGQVWATGDGAATTFEISRDMLVEGNRLKAGKYALFSIPQRSEWTLIFNRNWKQTGTNQYKPEQDVLRVRVTPRPAPANSDKLRFNVTAGGQVSLHWTTTSVGFKVLPVDRKE